MASTDLIAIRGEGLSAQINPLGAELFSLIDAEGRDLLWDGDPAVWAGHAPILFPIIGELVGGAYRLDGKTYPLSRHGFARQSGRGTRSSRCTYSPPPSPSPPPPVAPKPPRATPPSGAAA